ncbi:MAG: redox-regulated ATPase YchF [Patescibacteria group bacterium]|nr:redox-regulated ATPase YchF [Patescibacteria group bacterium]
MKLSIGIVGLPNVGKSTLFKILTKQQVHIANYPFATIDPNVGVVSVPDERLEKLVKLFASKKVIPAVVEFYDIAGLVKGAYKGEGLGNQFLTHIRDCRIIVQVVRCFKQNDIVHIEGTPDPIRDIETIKTELGLKDLETIGRRLEKAESQAKSGDKKIVKDIEIIKKIKSEIEKGEFITDFAKEQIVQEMQLLTAKKQIILLNGDEEDIDEKLKKYLTESKANYIVADLTKTENLLKLISQSYELLNLISFFTIGVLTDGEDEVRAWAIEKGTKAREAAGVIHTDFEHKFIRAEIINWQKLIETEGWNQAKHKGLIRIEGKEYVVQDGDVMVLKHG